MANDLLTKDEMEWNGGAPHYLSAQCSLERRSQTENQSKQRQAGGNEPCTNADKGNARSAQCGGWKWEGGGGDVQLCPVAYVNGEGSHSTRKQRQSSDLVSPNDMRDFEEQIDREKNDILPNTPHISELEFLSGEKEIEDSPVVSSRKHAQVGVH